MIKTLDNTEFQVLNKILVNYYHYILQYPETRLVKFYALYGIKMYGHLQYVVVMNNIFSDGNVDVIKLSRRYDLKGSKIDRYTPTPDKSEGFMSGFMQTQTDDKINKEPSQLSVSRASTVSLAIQALQVTVKIQLQGKRKKMSHFIKMEIGQE